MLRSHTIYTRYIYIVVYIFIVDRLKGNNSGSFQVEMNAQYLRRLAPSPNSLADRKNRFRDISWDRFVVGSAYKFNKIIK